MACALPCCRDVARPTAPWLPAFVNGPISTGRSLASWVVMATTKVDDIMSRELVYLSEGSRAALALPHILRFGITAVPVLDRDHRPVGVVSLRDLVAHGASPSDGTDRMTSPAHVIASGSAVEDAARALAATGHHHVVVVDAGGRAIGMLSALDVLRAMVGLPSRHPATLGEVRPSPRIAD
jgi:CBS-domain-containing membrane protein